MMQGVPRGNVPIFCTLKEEQMGDKGKKDKDKHNKQVVIAKNEAKNKPITPKHT